MLVSIIIINYNTFQITCNCIESIIKYTKRVNYEIIVVDNASPSDNPDYFLLKFPEIKLIKSKENGGFAKGNNIGIAESKGDIVLLLNSDTLLTEDSISKAAGKLNSIADIGALTVRLTYPDGRLQHTARKFRSIKNEILDLFRPFVLMLPYKKRAAMMLNQYFKGDYDTFADWVSGAFMMFNKSLLDLLPGKILDERFFMYGEDQLWCYQFHKLGYRNYYFSGTTVIHINNASTAPGKRVELFKKMLALEIYLFKYINGKSLKSHLFTFILTLKETARYFIKRIVFNFKH